jgi:hypothetical protein
MSTHEHVNGEMMTEVCGRGTQHNDSHIRAVNV